MANEFDISKINVKPGDHLIVRVGMTEEETGQAPWIPSQLDFEEIHKTFEELPLPEGSRILIMSKAVDIQILSFENGLCPRCEDAMIMNGDHLCEKCRYG